jgi:hypothetical protein
METLCNRFEGVSLCGKRMAQCRGDPHGENITEPSREKGNGRSAEEQSR